MGQTPRDAMAGTTSYTLTVDDDPPAELVDPVADRAFVEHLNEREADPVVAHLKDL